jgi:hypothetical protein
MQGRATEKRHFHVLREAVITEELALSLDAMEGRVPFDSLAHAGDGADDELVEAAPDLLFPTRHGCDVGLHGRITLGLANLRVAAGEETRLCSLASF